MLPVCSCSQVAAGRRQMLGTPSQCSAEASCMTNALHGGRDVAVQEGSAHLLRQLQFEALTTELQGALQHPTSAIDKVCNKRILHHIKCRRVVWMLRSRRAVPTCPQGSGSCCAWPARC